MVRLTKKIEYALMALKYISDECDKIVTAKQISENLNIPNQLLAKILQKLKKEKILESVQGIKGGYKLGKKLNEISLSFLIETIEGDMGIVDCLKTDRQGECCQTDSCNIKDPINQVQTEIYKVLKNKMVSDFV
ncbi:MAG: Rrf2 family transcriptional regulator [Ignavibacteria bacterium]|nr:Rrf2 family transcriptional regulator [Ignavibacteria bacterium]